MASVDEFLAALFETLGPIGALVALFLVFAVDAAVFPLLPEFAVVLTFSFLPRGFGPVTWGLLLLSMAVAGEAVGNTALYLFVRRALIQKGRMPATIERLMRRWMDFLVVRDERIILVNRVAPVVPMVGAFIATMRWDYRKSLAYIVVGSAVRYSALLLLTGWVGVVYDPVAARWLTVGLVVVIVALSVVGSFTYRRRALGKKPAREPSGESNPSEEDR
jgi:membrane protein YqaA with SNARE-associated domain